MEDILGKAVQIIRNRNLKKRNGTKETPVTLAGRAI